MGILAFRRGMAALRIYGILAPAILERLRLVLYGAGQFCLDWLTEHKGLYHTCLSASCENFFLDEEECCSAASSTAMAMTLINWLFTNRRTTL